MTTYGINPPVGNANVPAPAIVLREITVSFRLGDGATYRAIENASLAVADGEFVAIVGPTGCGKSTLLNIAAGLIAPSAGHVDIFGARLGGLNRQAGYLFQAEALFPWKSALDNVAVALEAAGAGRREARARAIGLVAWASASLLLATRTCFRAARESASRWCRC